MWSNFQCESFFSVHLQPKHSVKHGGGMTVGDAMKAANKRGSSYSLLTGNCIHAAKDVMKMKKK